MIEKVECFVVSCDNCKELLGDSEGYTIFSDELVANDKIGNSEWIKLVNNHYCPECAHFDDGDNLIIDKSRKVV